MDEDEIIFDNLEKKFTLSPEHEILEWISDPSLMVDRGAVLHYAAKYHMVSVIKYLIERIGETDFNEGLSGACAGGHRDIVDMMIGYGASFWEWGLHSACEGGHLEIIDYMFEKGAEGRNGGLANACYCGQEAVVKKLIEKGADSFDWGLEEACKGRHLEIANLMAEQYITDFGPLFHGGFDDSALCPIVCRHYDRMKEKRARIPVSLMSMIKIKYLVVFNKKFSPDISRVILSFMFV